MNQIFGEYTDIGLHNQEYLKIRFSPSSLPLQQRWRNNGLSADFLADYMTTFFPGETAPDGFPAPDRQAQMKDAVSYVANELLENAMKFSHAPDRYPVTLILQLSQTYIRFYVQNNITPVAAAAFHACIWEIMNTDPDRLYLARLTANAETANNDRSGLGFLTMINHYQAQLAWKFVADAHEPTVMTVTTMVQLAV